jgi:hypothetical protein
MLNVMAINRLTCLEDTFTVHSSTYLKENLKMGGYGKIRNHGRDFKWILGNGCKASWKQRIGEEFLKLTHVIMGLVEDDCVK